MPIFSPLRPSSTSGQAMARNSQKCLFCSIDAPFSRALPQINPIIAEDPLHGVSFSFLFFFFSFLFFFLFFFWRFTIVEKGRKKEGMSRLAKLMPHSFQIHESQVSQGGAGREVDMPARKALIAVLYSSPETTEK
jgi:hypothetical protein